MEDVDLNNSNEPIVLRPGNLPPCDACNKNDGWYYTGQKIDVMKSDSKDLTLYSHACRCGQTKSIAVSQTDFSFHLPLEPKFFARPNEEENLSESYVINYQMHYNLLRPRIGYICDYPECNRPIDVLVFNNDGLYLLLLLNGKCRMSISNDGSRWERLDFCKEHEEFGEHEYIASSPGDQAVHGDEHIDRFHQLIKDRMNIDPETAILSIDI